MKRLLPLLALVAVLFTSCPDPREIVNFDTDARVLRGSWNFVITDFSTNTLVSTQAVVFTPTFVSESRYTVVASVTLEGEVYELSGGVNGSNRNSRFVRPQFTPAPDAWMTFTKITTEKTYYARLSGSFVENGRWKFIGNLSTTENGVTKNQRLEITRN